MSEQAMPPGVDAEWLERAEEARKAGNVSEEEVAELIKRLEEELKSV